MNYANVKVKFLNPFFLYKFLSCACMSKLLPPKYYQKNKERLQKKKNACEDIKIYLKKKKKKKWQYGCECYKNFSKDEWFSTEKILRNAKKHLIIKSNTHKVLLKVYTE